VLSPLNQECGGEEIDEVEEFEIENSMENWVGPDSHESGEDCKAVCDDSDEEPGRSLVSYTKYYTIFISLLLI
jgi:hypothetical protein